MLHRFRSPLCVLALISFGAAAPAALLFTPLDLNGKAVLADNWSPSIVAYDVDSVLVEVELGPSAPYRAALWKRGLLVPPPVRATFLVDTGCDSTTVSESALNNAGTRAVACFPGDCQWCELQD